MTLDTEASIVWPGYEPRTFPFTNTAAYSYYRLYITANGGSPAAGVEYLAINASPSTGITGTVLTDTALTSGYYTLAGTGGLLGNGHLNDGVTTAGTITSTEPVAMATGSAVNGSLIPVVAAPMVGQAACIKAAGPPVQIGYCSTVVSSTGSCTCN